MTPPKPAAEPEVTDLLIASPITPPPPPGPRGITTSEFLIAAVAATLVLAAAVAVLIWSPDPAQRKTVSDTLTKLVELAAAYVLSRGLAKFGTGVAHGDPPA